MTTTDQVSTELLKLAPQLGVIIYLVVVFLRHLASDARRHEEHLRELNARHEKQMGEIMARYAQVVDNNTLALGGVRQMAREHGKGQP